MQHSTCPAFTWNAHDVASKVPLLRSAGFRPRFHVAYLNHFSHTLTPNMQNFVPWILPAHPAWSSNHALDHTSEVDIKFFHIGNRDAPGPSSKTSTWCHDGIDKVPLHAATVFCYPHLSFTVWCSFGAVLLGGTFMLQTKMRDCKALNLLHSPM